LAWAWWLVKMDTHPSSSWTPRRVTRPFVRTMQRTRCVIDKVMTHVARVKCDCITVKHVTLPADVTSASSLPVFKNTLKTYLSSAADMTFSLTFPTLDCHIVPLSTVVLAIVRGYSKQFSDATVVISMINFHYLGEVLTL